MHLFSQHSTDCLSVPFSFHLCPHCYSSLICTVSYITQLLMAVSASIYACSFFVSLFLSLFFSCFLSCFLSFILTHCKHPVYCFPAHSSSTLFSPTVWSHQKELAVSGFSGVEDSRRWRDFHIQHFLRYHNSTSYFVLSHSLQHYTRCLKQLCMHNIEEFMHKICLPIKPFVLQS